LRFDILVAVVMAMWLRNIKMEIVGSPASLALIYEATRHHIIYCYFYCIMEKQIRGTPAVKEPTTVVWTASLLAVREVDLQI